MKKNFLRQTKDILGKTFKGFSNDNIMKLSASLAYYTVFSMGPLLVVIISVCGLFFERDAIEGRIYRILQDFVGFDTAKQLQDIVKSAAINNHGILAAVIGGITLLIGATSVFAEIQDSINTIWGLKTKPKSGWRAMLVNRLMSFSIIAGLGFLLLVSLTATALIEGLNSKLKEVFPHMAVAIFYIINLALTFGVSAMIFAVIFRVLPDAKIKWRDVLIGALFTAILFILGKFAISLYISKAKIGSTYGAAGAFVVLLVWIYYSSIILYLGAEFTKAYAVQYGCAIEPNDYAVTTKQVLVETNKATIQQNERQSDKSIIKQQNGSSRQK